MANAEDIRRAVGQRAQRGTAIQDPTGTLQGLLSNDSVKHRFEEMLGTRAAGFLSNVLSVTNGNRALQEADPRSILTAAAMAASLDLPINPNLGFAAIVPYAGKAQFQVMTRGYVQLGMRTGQYRLMNVAEVYEGEILSENRITGEIVFNPTGRTSDKIIGYAAYFRLLNGFEKYLYMTSEQIDAHARKYAKSYTDAKGRWQQDWHSMALKTVLKRLLSKWGVLSIEMQRAIIADQAVITDTPDGERLEYIDSPGDGSVFLDDLPDAGAPVATGGEAQAQGSGEEVPA